jgi:hypothetical protein
MLQEVGIKVKIIALRTKYIVREKLRGFSPLENYTNRAIAAGQRS